MKKTYNILNSFIVLFLLAFVANMFINTFVFKGGADSAVINYDNGWFYENGVSADLMDLKFKDGSTSISRYISGSEASGMSICCISRNVDFTVLLDDREIYELHPEPSPFYGKYYGDYINVIKIPYFEGICKLEIKCTYRTNNRWTGFGHMKLEDSTTFFRDFLHKNMMKFLICVIAFFSGLLLMMLALLQRSDIEHMTETASLGVITVVLSVWTAPTPGIMQLITGGSHLARMLNYYTLMLLPIPTFIFVATFTRTKNRILMNILMGAAIANLLLNASLVSMKIADYSQFLIITHIIVLLGSIYIIFMIINSIIKKRINQKQCQYIIASMSVIIISGLIDMYRFYFTMAEDNSAAVRIGLLFFVMILAVYEYLHLIEVQVKAGRSELMQKIAMEDVLTGMNNRTAFKEHEASILKRENGKVLFIHFDVNGLKTVNDNYGHEAGDKHIIAASNVLKESFGKFGKCYRVGGDEFFAILEGKNSDEDYEIALNDFFELQDEYNDKNSPPVKLQIAYGMAEYNCSDKNPEEAEKLADSRMYEKKKAMKLLNT
ncbi:MAG: GGDEF domain-containing protein [Ruminococcus sp.]|nr:GGDEF domain-containing protein [Ruminococcus sp.]